MVSPKSSLRGTKRMQPVRRRDEAIPTNLMFAKSGGLLRKVPHKLSQFSRNDDFGGIASKSFAQTLAVFSQ